MAGFALILDAAFTDPVALTVQDTDLMGLRAPINPHKPLIGDGMIRVLMAAVLINRYSHYFLSSLWHPVVRIRPYTGARGATSYEMCTTGPLLGYMSK
jgi:hypothetical protein